MPTVTDQAICVRVWDWSETSQTVSVFGRETGMVRAVAKGAKRENAKFSGGLEVPTRGEMVVSVKSGETLSLLTAWDLQELFPGVRRTLGGFYAAMCAVELVSHALTEQDPHPRLFDGLLAALRGLGGPEGDHGDRGVLLSLLWLTLEDTGHRPELELDVLSGREVEAAPTYGFVPTRGGITADPRVGPAGREPVWRVRAETVDLLRTVSERGGGSLANAPAAAVERALRLMLLYYSETFHVRPSGVEAFLGGRLGGGYGAAE